MNDTLINIDAICADHGFGIVDGNTESKKVKELETLVTKSLGVLQENGVYAYFLFLANQKAEKIKDKSLNLLRHEKINLTQKKDDYFMEIREQITNDLDKLLFARQLLEQMLIYARYHAKAMNMTAESNTAGSDTE